MKLNPGSVVYGRMSDEHNNPTLPKRDVVDAGKGKPAENAVFAQHRV